MASGTWPFGYGSQNSVTPHLIEMGGRIYGGNAFFVDSGNANAGTTSNEGTKRKPCSTIDAAINQCTANNGDVIFVLPGHAETVSAADHFDADIAGISIIGIGNGTNRPTLTYTVAAGECTLGADNVWIENIRFVSAVTEVLIGLDIEDGVDFATVKNCSFTVTSDTVDDFVSAIRFTNNNTGCVVDNCYFDSGLQAHAVQAILLDADTEAVEITNNRIQGDYTTGCIVGNTTASTEVLIQNNILQNGDTGGIGTVAAISLLTATTGLIADNYIMLNVANYTLSVLADTCVLFNNAYSETVGPTKGTSTTSFTYAY